MIRLQENGYGPAGIAFAGVPMLAFVSCAKENTVQVFDAITRQVVTNLAMDGERPTSLMAGHSK